MLKKILLIALCFLSIGVRSELYTGGVADVTNGLIAHWKLDELSYNGAAGEVKDSSGNGNNGTSFSKAITNPSKLGRSAFFNGVTSGIRIDDSSFISEAGPYTLSVWIYPLMCSYGERILSKRGTTCRFDLLIGYNDYIIEFYDGIYSTGILTGKSMLNRWMNIVVVADGISTISWYIDGVLSTSHNDRNIVSSDADIGIGCFGSGTSKFNGFIDDVRIYNRAITSNEVTKLYNLGTPKKETVAYRFAETHYENLPTNGLVLHYKMDENNWNGTAGEVIDSSGNGFNGTSYGGVFTNPGKINRGAALNGTSGRLQSGSYDAGDVTNNFMAFLWIKMYGSNLSRLLCKRYSTTQYDFYTENGAQLNFYNGAIARGFITDNFSDNKWHHIGFGVTNSILIFYKDGVIYDTSEVVEITSKDEMLGIGSFPYAALSPFNGLIDDVRIYNRVLSSNEISQIYNAELKSKMPIAAYAGNKLVYNPSKKNFASMSYQNVTNGLVAWWKLDEMNYDGTVGEVKDSSGNGNHGTSYLGVFTNPGKINRAGMFDGVNDYLSASKNNWNILTNISLSVWIKTSAENKFANTCFIWGLPAASTDRIFGIRLDSGVFLCEIGTYSQYQYFYQNGATKWSDNLWHHAVLTYDDNKCKLYIDNIFNTEINISGGLNLSGNYINHVLIGGTGHYFFDGAIDDVRIYNRALTQEEITTIYNRR